jgi:hypothetical protein
MGLFSIFWLGALYYFRENSITAECRTEQGNRLKYKDYHFSVARMMDWRESSSFSIDYRAACARRVQREIKKNLPRASVVFWCDFESLQQAGGRSKPVSISIESKEVGSRLIKIDAADLASTSRRR